METDTFAVSATPFGAATMILVLPLPRAVTNPLELTVAIATFPEDQLKVVLIVLPLWSRAVAASCCVWPTAVKLLLSGDTVTVVTVGLAGGEVVPGALYDAQATSPSFPAASLALTQNQ